MLTLQIMDDWSHPTLTWYGEENQLLKGGPFKSAIGADEVFYSTGKVST